MPCGTSSRRPTSIPTGAIRPDVTRAISLVLAGAISLVVLLYPYAFGRAMTPLTHSLLPVMLLGVAGGFVHGLGFVPSSRLVRWLFAPASAWGLMLVPLWLLLV